MTNHLTRLMDEYKAALAEWKESSRQAMRGAYLADPQATYTREMDAYTRWVDLRAEIRKYLAREQCRTRPSARYILG